MLTVLILFHSFITYVSLYINIFFLLHNWNKLVEWNKKKRNIINCIYTDRFFLYAFSSWKNVYVHKHNCIFTLPTAQDFSMYVLIINTCIRVDKNCDKYCFHNLSHKYNESKENLKNVALNSTIFHSL